MSALARLRAATVGDHHDTDVAFGRFDLKDAASYIAFLRAHARVLPAIEEALEGEAALPPFRPRTPAIEADLAALGSVMPEPLPIAVPKSEGARFGTLYVIEGSRLGGGVLAGQVGVGLPNAYLSAKHEPGEWRAFCQRLDAAAKDEAWTEDAVAAAKATFGLYRKAAQQEG
jgi:heme oxygenase (biliverdin-IX-beta and delta-forming)